MTSQTFLNMTVTSFLPSQSANSTSWKMKGEDVMASVMRTTTCVAVAIWGPLICRNSSFDRPSFMLSWWITCNFGGKGRLCRTSHTEREEFEWKVRCNVGLPAVPAARESTETQCSEDHLTSERREIKLSNSKWNHTVKNDHLRRGKKQ